MFASSIIKFPPTYKWTANSLPIHLHRTPTALHKPSSIASAFLILAAASVQAALAAAAAAAPSRNEQKQIFGGGRERESVKHWFMLVLNSLLDECMRCRISLYIAQAANSPPSPSNSTSLQYEAIKEKAARLQFCSRSNCSLMTKKWVRQLRTSPLCHSALGMADLLLASRRGLRSKWVFEGGGGSLPYGRRRRQSWINSGDLQQQHSRSAC